MKKVLINPQCSIERKKGLGRCLPIVSKYVMDGRLEGKSKLPVNLNIDGSEQYFCITQISR